MTTQPTVTVPNVTLTLEQLMAAIRQLDEEGRAQVAQALLAEEMDGKLAALIQRLAAKTPDDTLSDAEIDEEVKAVRRQAQR